MTKIPLLVALACLTLPMPVPAKAEKPISRACLDRQIADRSGCECLQTLGEETVRQGLQDLIAEYLGRQINTAAIAAERGHSGAEQLASEAYLFRRHAIEHCGITLPKT